MFIRIKKVSGKTYAYLVQNVWTSAGTRQKAKGYLGRVYVCNPVLIDAVDFSCLQPDKNRQKQAIELVIEIFLEKLGFVKEKASWKLSIEKKIITYSGKKLFCAKKPVVLQVGEGYFCTYTIQKLFSLSSDLEKIEQSRQRAKLLALRFVNAGIQLDAPVFIQLYKFISQNDSGDEQ
ncbi:MAG: hypothetical protein ACMXYF_02500 [Candidatus Woesearchaeota archaeon]